MIEKPNYIHYCVDKEQKLTCCQIEDSPYLTIDFWYNHEDKEYCIMVYINYCPICGYKVEEK
jgi:hypothetical protein